MDLNINRVSNIKVDQTCLPIGNSGDIVFISNINIPESYLESPELPSLITRIRDFILNDYSTIQNVSFQVCASYNLVHSETGAIRYFHGSFMPGANRANSLLDFRHFGPEFVNQLTDTCKRDICEFVLKNVNLETSYVFHSLVSIIVSVQAKVKITHPKLMQRGFVSRKGNRYLIRNAKVRRIQATFPLP